MGEWLKKFWTDPVFFATTLRTAISFLGGLVASGIIPTDKWRLGFLVMALAQGIPATRPKTNGDTPQNGGK